MERWWSCSDIFRTDSTRLIDRFFKFSLVFVWDAIASNTVQQHSIRLDKWGWSKGANVSLTVLIWIANFVKEIVWQDRGTALDLCGVASAQNNITKLSERTSAMTDLWICTFNGLKNSSAKQLSDITNSPKRRFKLEVTTLQRQGIKSASSHLYQSLE